MSTELLYSLSPNELEKEIKAIVCKDQRSIPSRAKIFAAVAKIQKFDLLPELLSVEDLNHWISNNCIELNRGLSSTKGIPSLFYAMELVRGAMYPGTLTALGHGIYFAVPSAEDPKFQPNFPKVSIAALKYTTDNESGNGCLVRAALKNTAKIIDHAQIHELAKIHKERAKAAGIADIGTLAASLGYDAIFADGIYEDTDERVYAVLNRGLLSVQKLGTMVANK